MYEAIPIERRNRIIHDFPYRAQNRICPHAAIVNITKSGHCCFSCVYCYARGYPWSHSEHSVEVFQNTPELLDAELSSIRICPPLYFCAVTDPFQPFDLVLKTSLRAMSVAVKHNVFFTIVTKSDLVLRILETSWSDYERFRVSVTCESINDNKLRVLSNAPPAFKRLRAIEELINAGIDAAARVDPIISGITDEREELDELFKELSSIEVKNVTISTGTFRANVFHKLLSALDCSVYSDSVAKMRARYTLDGGYYRLRLEDRLSLYRYIESLCKRYNLTLSICLERVDSTLFQRTQCTTLGKLAMRDQCGNFAPICHGDCLTTCPNLNAPPCASSGLATEYPYKWATLR